MKKNYFLSLMVLLASFLCSTSVSAQTLIAHYKFDEGSGTVATDASGSGNNGVIEGTPNWVAGEIDGALQFTGADKVVMPGDFMALTSAQGSVAFWLIAGANTDINTCWWAGDTELGNGFGADNEMHIHFEAPVADIWMGGELGFWAKGEPDNVHLFSDPDKDTGAGAGVPPVNPTLVNDSVWHHIAGTWGNGYLSLYIDGVLIMQKAYVSANFPLTYMLLGKMAGRDNRTLNGGSIDDVRVYDGAIDAFTVEDLFNKVPPIGVDQLTANDFNMSVYPNPAKGNTVLRFTGEAGKAVSVKMYNITGSLIGNVYQGVSQAGNNTITLQTAEYTPGIYFVELNVGDKTVSSRLVKAKM
ncbi:MAG TPA: T9SS type A sorting domain-containing protein [Prolixibacteraceae bacterium]|nr:T9SS type A sorting domain-containing protein [Prolixibacteraceae bacterium]